MNKITAASTAPNRYRPSSIQGGIVVRCKCTADARLNHSIHVRSSSRSGPGMSGPHDQQHVVIITITRIRHQIPIGRHSL